MSGLLLLGCGAGTGGIVTDPDFASVLLLMGFNGTDGSTAITDESPSARTVTVAGNAQIDTAQSKFGGSSLLLDGTGDYLTVPDSADWNFAGQFTLEAFFRLSSSAPNNTEYIVMSHRGSSAQLAWLLSVTSSASTPGITVHISTNGSTEAHNVFTASGGMFSTDTWHHIAADRDGSGKLRIYLDGVMKSSKLSATGTPFDLSNPVGIGASGTGLRPFFGHLDEVRITAGTARYASDGGFTVPTAAFPRT
jgi:hypothetical protein